MYEGIKIEESPLGATEDCPLCGRQSCVQASVANMLKRTLCPCCGQFRYQFGAFGQLINTNDPRRYIVSHRLRAISEMALSAKPDNALFPIYTHEDIDKMLMETPLPVQEKINFLLRYLAKLNGHPGQEAWFDVEYDYTILQARDSQEADFYVESLKERSLIRTKRSLNGNGVSFTLTTDGWMELERISQSGAQSSNAFIAMWFDSSRLEFDAAIKQATRGAGYLPIRMDQVEHVNRIDDEIIARIRQAKFLIADFSGQNRGVYFEAGFMLGLGRTVIWVCDKKDLKELHFDTRQYNTIDYEDAADLQKRLQYRIEALFGKGPHASN